MVVILPPPPVPFTKTPPRPAPVSRIRPRTVTTGTISSTCAVALGHRFSLAAPPPPAPSGCPERIETEALLRRAIPAYRGRLPISRRVSCFGMYSVMHLIFVLCLHKSGLYTEDRLPVTPWRTYSFSPGECVRAKVCRALLWQCSRSGSVISRASLETASVASGLRLQPRLCTAAESSRPCLPCPCQPCPVRRQAPLHQPPSGSGPPMSLSLRACRAPVQPIVEAIVFASAGATEIRRTL